MSHFYGLLCPLSIPPQALPEARAQSGVEEQFSERAGTLAAGADAEALGGSIRRARCASRPLLFAAAASVTGQARKLLRADSPLWPA